MEKRYSSMTLERDLEGGWFDQPPCLSSELDSDDGFGRTPLHTFRETKRLAQTKQLDTLFEWQQPKTDIPDNTAADFDAAG